MKAGPNFRTLDLNLLRVFDQVMAERNLTRAARNLAMTQPAVSNALRRLREATNEELFIPTSTGVTPTVHDGDDPGTNGIRAGLLPVRGGSDRGAGRRPAWFSPLL